MTDRYAGDGLDVAEIWSWYGRRIARLQPAGVGPGDWHYGRFSDGALVPYAARVLYRDSREHSAAPGDPFDATGPFRAWLDQTRPGLVATPYPSAYA